MQYLDALEGLRSQGIPDELNITYRYEILQLVMKGVRDPTFRRNLAIIYASKVSLTVPPIVESSRLTTRQLQRNRPKSLLPFDHRFSMRSRHHEFVPSPPNKMVMPQGMPCIQQCACTSHVRSIGNAHGAERMLK